jgi:type I restriction enzyme S subunit
MTGTIPLGELIAIRGGGTPSRSIPAYWNGEIRWATVKDFKSTELAETEESITPEGINASATNVIPAGSVIIPTRMAVGKAAINTIDLAINQDLKALLPGSEVDSRFLLHFMLAQGKYLENQAQGATVKGIKLDLLRSLPFPKIPLSEQRRIATILDKADAISRKREQALTLADEFLKSVFMEMFGDLSSNSRNWQTKTIGQILELEPQNGLYRHSSDYGSGPQILRIDGFYDGYLSAQREMKRVRIDQRTFKTYELVSGDIVINRVNSPEYLGKCALVEGLTEPTVFESNMMRFRVDARIANPRFIVDQLRSTYLKNQIARAAKPAVNQSSINQKDVKSFEIRLPPPELQNKYAGLVASKLNADNGLRSAFLMAISLLESLSQCAFRGEL